MKKNFGMDFFNCPTDFVNKKKKKRGKIFPIFHEAIG